YEVATAGRLALEPELGAVPRASRDLHLERLAAHPDAGRAAAEGVEQADVEVRLGTGGSRRRAAGAEALPRTPELGREASAGEAASRETTEEALEEVGEVPELLRRHGAEPAGTGLERRNAARAAVLVVQLALLLVGEDRVGLVYLLEALL